MCLFWHINGWLYTADYGPLGKEEALTIQEKHCGSHNNGTRSFPRVFML